MLIHADSITRHTASFQIPFLESCPLSIGWKISLISLAMYVIFLVSLIRKPILPDTGSFRFKLIHSLEKYEDFIHRQCATNYKVQGTDLRENGITLYCWAVQVGLLTPLTFTWHHLSPLAAFTSGVNFLHN